MAVRPGIQPATEFPVTEMVRSVACLFMGPAAPFTPAWTLAGSPLGAPEIQRRHIRHIR